MKFLTYFVLLVNYLFLIGVYFRHFISFFRFFVGMFTHKNPPVSLLKHPQICLQCNPVLAQLSSPAFNHHFNLLHNRHSVQLISQLDNLLDSHLLNRADNLQGSQLHNQVEDRLINPQDNLLVNQQCNRHDSPQTNPLANQVVNLHRNLAANRRGSLLRVPLNNQPVNPRHNPPAIPQHNPA